MANDDPAQPDRRDFLKQVATLASAAPLAKVLVPPMIAKPPVKLNVPALVPPPPNWSVPVNTLTVPLLLSAPLKLVVPAPLDFLNRLPASLVIGVAAKP